MHSMDIKQYQFYELDDFMEDPIFRQWVQQPTKDLDQFWSMVQQHYPAQQAPIEKAKTLLLSLNATFEQSQANEQEIEQKLQQLLPKVTHQGKLKGQAVVVRRRPFLRVAAAVTLLIISGAVAWLLLNPSSKEMLVYQTAFGEWETILLPDSSIVELNAHSILKVEKDWVKGTDRKVWLDGEAFFKVKKQPATNAKFRVITDELAVEVLGTAFNVHSRSDHTQVFLEEGSVKLDLEQQDQKAIVMEPGEWIRYSGEKQAVTTRVKDVPKWHITSWKDGVLLFKETPLYMVLNRMEEIYGVPFEVADSSLIDRKITAGIPMEKFDIALPILEKALNLSITRDSTKIILN